jgi:hypothetical protein
VHGISPIRSALGVPPNSAAPVAVTTDVADEDVTALSKAEIVRLLSMPELVLAIRRSESAAHFRQNRKGSIAF